MKKIKTIMFIDMMGAISLNVSQEDEFKTNKKTIERVFKENNLNMCLSPCKLTSAPQNVLTDKWDLVLFDYGGMAMGNSLLEHNSRYLGEYIKNHPNTLLVVWSDMTVSGFEDEVDEEIVAQPNVILKSFKNKNFWNDFINWFKNKK